MPGRTHAVAGDFHSHAGQDASGKTFGNLPQRNAECRCHRCGSRRIGCLMFSGKTPVHHDAFSGSAIDQLKRASRDVPATVDRFHDGVCSFPVAENGMISGRLFHDVESGCLERNDRDSLRRKMTENRGFFSRHPLQRTEILQMAASDGDDQCRIGTDAAADSEEHRSDCWCFLPLPAHVPLRMRG